MVKRKPLLVLACLLSAGMIVSCGVSDLTTSENNQISSSAIPDVKSDSSSESKTSSEAQESSESVSSSSETQDSSSSSEEQPVVTTVDAYVEDECKLFSGNPFMSINGGDYTEVAPNADGKYTFTIGARIKMAMVSNGYIVPTGATINGVFHKINSNGFVIFTAEEDESSTAGDTTMEIIAEYEDTTPSEKAYKIEVTNSANITLHLYNENKNAEITSCDMGDVVYIKAEAADGYKVKSITGYTIQDSSNGSKKTLDIKYSESDGYYSFTCPFSVDEIIKITVEEIDATAFADSDLIGDYLVVRTYSLSGSSYINKFSGNSLSVNESGEMVYSFSDSSASTMYMQDEQNDTVSVKNGNSSITMYKGNNIIIFGQAVTGSQVITPLTGDSNDVSVAIKKKEGTSTEDYTMKNNAFTVNGDSYAVFNFYLNNTPYASCYITTSNKQIVTDVELKMYNGTAVSDDKAVYDVLHGSDILLSTGYIDEGGNSNRTIITDFANGYTNTDHTLVFTSNTTALYDGESYNITTEENGLKLLNPNKEVHITLNDDMSFTVISEAAVEKQALDIANKVFTGQYYDNFSNDDPTPVKCTVTFGESNDSITAKILSQDYFKYYWDFSATFDSSTNILTATITDRGYGGKSVSTWPNLGTQFKILLENGQLTFKDDWAGNQTTCFKNCVFTCADFKL